MPNPGYRFLANQPLMPQTNNRQSFLGEVVHIEDADTIYVRYKDSTGLYTTRSIRAANINAPETYRGERNINKNNKIEANQFKYGDLATKRLREILAQNNNRILIQTTSETDIHSRTIGAYFTPSGQSIEEMLVKEGLALFGTTNEKFIGSNPALELQILKAQQEAQKLRAGIFEEGLYLAPEQFLAERRRVEAAPEGTKLTLGSPIDNFLGLFNPYHRFQAYVRRTEALKPKLQQLAMLETDVYESNLNKLRERYGDEASKLADPITYYRVQAYRRNIDYQTYTYANSARNIFGESRVLLKTPIYGDISTRLFESIYQAKRVSLGLDLLDDEEIPDFIIELDKRRTMLSPVERANRYVFNNQDSVISPYVALSIGISGGIAIGMAANITLEAAAYNLTNYGTLTERAFTKQAQSIGKTILNNRGRLVTSSIIGLITGALLTANLSNKQVQEVLNLGYASEHKHRRLLFDSPSDSLTKDLYMAVVNRLDVLINGLNVGSRGTTRTRFGNIREQPQRDSTIFSSTLESIFNVSQDLILGTAIYYGLMRPAQDLIQDLISKTFHYTLSGFGGLDKIQNTALGSAVMGLRQSIVSGFREVQAQNAFLGLFGRIGAASGLDIQIVTPIQGAIPSKVLMVFDKFEDFSSFFSRIDSQLIDPASSMVVRGADPTAYRIPDSAGIPRTIGFKFGGVGRQVSFAVNKDRLWEGFIGISADQKLVSAQKFADALNDLFAVIGYEGYGTLKLSSGLEYSAEDLMGGAREQLKQAQIQKAMSQIYANPLRWLGIVPAGVEATEVSMAAVFGSSGFISRTVGYATGIIPRLYTTPQSATIKTGFDEINYILKRFTGQLTPQQAAEQLQAIKTSRNILTTRQMMLHRGASINELDSINEIIERVVDPRSPTSEISSVMVGIKNKTSLVTKFARAGATALVYGLLASYMFKTSTGLDAITQFGDAIAQLGLEFPVPNDSPLINIGWASTSIMVRDRETDEVREEIRTPWFNRAVYLGFASYAVFSYFAFEGQASILKANASRILATIPGAAKLPSIERFIRDSFDDYFINAGLKTATGARLRATDFNDLTSLLKHGPNFTQTLTASKVVGGRVIKSLLYSAGALTAISLIAGLTNSISYSLKVSTLGGMYREESHVDPTLNARLKYLWGVYEKTYFESPSKKRTAGLAPIYTYDAIRITNLDTIHQGESQGLFRQAGTQQIGSIYATTLFGYDITRNRMRFTTGMQLPLYTMGMGLDLPVQIILDNPTTQQLLDQQYDVSAYRYPVLPSLGENIQPVPIAIPFTGGRTGRFTYVASSTLAEFYKSYAALKVGTALLTVPAELLKNTGSMLVTAFDAMANQITKRYSSTFFNTVADSVTVVGEVFGGTLYGIGEAISDNIFVQMLKQMHNISKFGLDLATSALKAYITQGSRLVSQAAYSLSKSGKVALDRFMSRATEASANQVGNILANSGHVNFTRSQLTNITKGVGNLLISTYLGELVGQQIFGVEGVGGAIGLTTSLLQTIHSMQVTSKVNKFIRTDPRFTAQLGTVDLDDVGIANIRAAINVKTRAIQAQTKIAGILPRPTARGMGTIAVFVLGSAILYGAFENSNRRIPRQLRIPDGVYRFSIDLSRIPGYQALTTRKATMVYADGTKVETRIPKLFNLPTGGIYLPQKIDIGQMLKQLTGVSDRAFDFYSAPANYKAYNTYGEPIVDLIDPSILGPRVDYTKDRNLISILTRPFKILTDRTYFGNTLTDASGGGGIYLGFGGVTTRQYDGNIYAGSSYMQFQGPVSDISFAENIIQSAYTPGILQSVLGDSAMMLLNDQIQFADMSAEEKDQLVARLIFSGLPTKALPKQRQFSPLFHRDIYKVLSGNRATSAALARRQDYINWAANANVLDLVMMYNRTPFLKEQPEEGEVGFLPGLIEGFNFFSFGLLRHSNYFTEPRMQQFGRNLEDSFREGIQLTGRNPNRILIGRDVALGPVKTIGMIIGTIAATAIAIGVGKRILDRAYQYSGQALLRNMGVLNATYSALNDLIPGTVEQLNAATRLVQSSQISSYLADSDSFIMAVSGNRFANYTLRSKLNLPTIAQSIQEGQKVIGNLLSARQRALINLWGASSQEGIGGLLGSIQGAPNINQLDELVNRLNTFKLSLKTQTDLAAKLGGLTDDALLSINQSLSKISKLTGTSLDSLEALLAKSFSVDSKLTTELISSVDDTLTSAAAYRAQLVSGSVNVTSPVGKKLAVAMQALSTKLQAYTNALVNQIPLKSIGHAGPALSLTDRAVELGTGGLAERVEDIISAAPISTRPVPTSSLNAVRNKLAAARQAFNKLSPSQTALTRASSAFSNVKRTTLSSINTVPYVLGALKATDVFSENVAPSRAASGTVSAAEAIAQYSVTAFVLNKSLALLTSGLTLGTLALGSILGGSVVLGGLAVAALGISAIAGVGYLLNAVGIDKDKNFSILHALGQAFEKASKRRGHLGSKAQAFFGDLWESLGTTAGIIFKRVNQGIDYLTSLEVPFTGGYSYKTFRRDVTKALTNLSLNVRDAADSGDPFAIGFTGFMTRISDTRETIAVAAFNRYKNINRRMQEGNASLLETVEMFAFGVITNNLLTPSNPALLMDIQEVRDRFRYFTPFVPTGEDPYVARIEAMMADLAEQLDIGLGNSEMPLISALTYGVPNQNPRTVEGARNTALLSSAAGVQRATSRFRPISPISLATRTQLEIRAQKAAQVLADSHYRGLYVNFNLDNRRFFTKDSIPNTIFPRGVGGVRMRQSPPRGLEPDREGRLPMPINPNPPGGGFFGGYTNKPSPTGPVDFLTNILSFANPIFQTQRILSNLYKGVRTTRQNRVNKQVQATTGLSFGEQASVLLREREREREREGKRERETERINFTKGNIRLINPTVSNPTQPLDLSLVQNTSGVGYTDSGLRTGPAGSIGAGAAYHIDTKFSRSLPIETKVSLMDAIARGYQSQGRVIEFSNNIVSGLIYNPDLPYEQKASLIARAEAAHSHSVHKDFTSIDYYTPKIGTNRFTDETLRGGEILIPTLPGLVLNFGSGSGYGNYVVAKDKDGNIIYKTGHGDSRLPLPQDRVIEQTEFKPQSTTQSSENYVNLPQTRGKSTFIDRKLSYTLDDFHASYITAALEAGRSAERRQSLVDVAVSIENRLIQIYELGANFNQIDKSIAGIVAGRHQYEPHFYGRGEGNPDYFRNLTTEEVVKLVANRTGLPIEVVRAEYEQFAKDLLTPGSEARLSAIQSLQGRTDFKGINQKLNPSDSRIFQRNELENFFHYANNNMAKNSRIVYNLIGAAGDYLISTIADLTQSVQSQVQSILQNQVNLKGKLDIRKTSFANNLSILDTISQKQLSTLATSTRYKNPRQRFIELEKSRLKDRPEALQAFLNTFGREQEPGQKFLGIGVILSVILGSSFLAYKGTKFGIDLINKAGDKFRERITAQQTTRTKRRTTLKGEVLFDSSAQVKSDLDLINLDKSNIEQTSTSLSRSKIINIGGTVKYIRASDIYDEIDQTQHDTSVVQDLEPKPINQKTTDSSSPHDVSSSVKTTPVQNLITQSNKFSNYTDEILIAQAKERQAKQSQLKQTRIQNFINKYKTRRARKRSALVDKSLQSIQSESIRFERDVALGYTAKQYEQVTNIVQSFDKYIQANDLHTLQTNIKKSLSISKLATLQAISDYTGIKIGLTKNAWFDLDQPLLVILNEVKNLERDSTVLIGHGIKEDPRNPDELSWYATHHDIIDDFKQHVITVTPFQTLINQLDTGKGVFCYICDQNQRVTGTKSRNQDKSIQQDDLTGTPFISISHQRADPNYKSPRTAILNIKKRTSISADVPRYTVIDKTASTIDVLIIEPGKIPRLLGQSDDLPTLYSTGSGLNKPLKGDQFFTQLFYDVANLSGFDLNQTQLDYISSKLGRHLIPKLGIHESGGYGYKSSENIVNVPQSVYDSIQRGLPLTVDEIGLVAHEIRHALQHRLGTMDSVIDVKSPSESQKIGKIISKGTPFELLTPQHFDFIADSSAALRRIQRGLEYSVTRAENLFVSRGFTGTDLQQLSDIVFALEQDAYVFEYAYKEYLYSKYYESNVAPIDKRGLADLKTLLVNPTNTLLDSIGINQPLYSSTNNPLTTFSRTWDTWKDLLANRSRQSDITGYSGLSRTYNQVAKANSTTYQLATPQGMRALEHSAVNHRATILNVVKMAESIGIRVELGTDTANNAIQRERTKSGINVKGFYRGGTVYVSSGLSDLETSFVLGHEIHHAVQDLYNHLNVTLDATPSGKANRDRLERAADMMGRRIAQGKTSKLEKLVEFIKQRNLKKTRSSVTKPIDTNNIPLYKVDNQKPFIPIEFIKELSLSIDPTVDISNLVSIEVASINDFGIQMGEIFIDESSQKAVMTLRQDVYDRLTVGLATIEDLEIITHELGHYHFYVKGRAAEIEGSTLAEVEKAVSQSPFKDRILGSVAHLKAEVIAYKHQLDLSKPSHVEALNKAEDILKVKLYDEYVTYPFGVYLAEHTQRIYEQYDFFSVSQQPYVDFDNLNTLYSTEIKLNLAKSQTENSINSATQSVSSGNVGRFNNTDTKSNLYLTNRISRKVNDSQLSNIFSNQNLKNVRRVRTTPLTHSNQKNSFGEYKHSTKAQVKGSLDFVEPVANSPPTPNIVSQASTSKTILPLSSLTTNTNTSEPISVTGRQFSLNNDFVLPSAATVPNAVADNAISFRTGAGFVGAAGNAYDIAGTISNAVQQVFNLNQEQTFAVGIGTGALYLSASSGILGEKAGAVIVSAVEGKAVMGSTVINNAITQKLQLGGVAVPIAAQGSAIAGALYAGDNSKATQHQLISATAGAAASIVAGKLYAGAVAAMFTGPQGLLASGALLLTGLAIQMGSASIVSRRVSELYLRGALNNALRSSSRYYGEDVEIVTGHQRRRTPRTDRIATTNPAQAIANAENRFEADLRTIYESVRGSVEVLLRAQMENDLANIRNTRAELAGVRNRRAIRRKQRLGRLERQIESQLENNLDKLTDEYIDNQISLLKYQVALDDKPVRALENAVIDAIHSAIKINEAARDITGLNNQSEEQNLQVIRTLVRASEDESGTGSNYKSISQRLVEQSEDQRQRELLRTQSTESGSANQSTKSQTNVVDVIQPNLGNPRDIRNERGLGCTDTAKCYVQPAIVSATKAAIVKVNPTVANVVEGVSTLASKVIDSIQTMLKFNRPQEQAINSDPALQNSNPNAKIDPADS